jgi:hypothetical protein
MAPAGTKMTESAYAWYRELKEIEPAVAYYGLPGDILISGSPVILVNASREVSIAPFLGGGPFFRVALRGLCPDIIISTAVLDQQIKNTVFRWLLQGLS